jgi:hypothetical protein
MTSRTPKEVAAVSASLEAKGGVWSAPVPNYSNFSREGLLVNLDQAAAVVAEETDADRIELKQALVDSQTFVHSAFDYYEGKRDVGRPIARAFCVPMRSTRDHEANASESTPFLPLYDPARFGVNSDKRMRGMYGIPPTLLDTYTKSDADNETGALVLVPMYADMLNDPWPDTKDLVAVSGVILKEAIQFAHIRLGAKVVGLGATLPHPAATNFGRHLRAIDGMENLVTTTGHGGTVYMIAETVRKVLTETSIESRGRIGVIGGAGSIGWSTIVALLEMIEDHKIHSYDRRVMDLASYATFSDRIHVASTAADVLRETNIIVAAVTGRINLDDEAFAGIDLAGKVIIDDSQPGCFTRRQVEARDGKLVWVVGEDGSRSKFISRDGLHTNGVPYNYGDHSGLDGHHCEFACGQEAAVIAKYGAYEHAVRGPVTPEVVRTIGGLLKDAGATVAPFQAFGKPVEIR